MTNDTSPLIQHAQRYLAAGLSLIPVLADGSKGPAIAWKPYQQHPPAPQEIQQWFGNGKNYGIAIIGGKVSGSLEILDFDDAATYQEFLLRAEQSGLGPLIARIRSGCEESSPRGIHLPYRCHEIAGNTKLARRPSSHEERAKNPEEKIKGLIETRGEGGYVICAPSGGKVHESGKPYYLLQGSWGTVATITAEERHDIFALCRTFDQIATPVRTVIPESTDTQNEQRKNRPGDLFATATPWQDILTPAGWTWVFQRGEVEYWRRPGKSIGISASTNYAGSGLFYVFSSSTEFETERGYGKFSAYALLSHGGDYEKASRALVARGFKPQAAAPSSSSPPSASQPTPPIPAALQEIVLTCANLIVPEEVSWLWYPYLPLAKLCLLGGDPGLGKTWVALGLAAAYSRGHWPFLRDGPRSEMEPGQTLFCASEDGMADTLVPRLKVMGADLSRIVFLEGKKDEKGSLQRIVLNEEDILVRAIEECHAKLLIFDPFQRFLPPKAKMNEMETVSPIVSALMRVAQRTGATVLLLGHLNKSKQDTIGYKFMGSVDWFAAARSALMVMKDPENPLIGRYLYQVKNSLAPQVGGVSFTLQPTDIPFQWGTHTDVSAEEMFSNIVSTKAKRADSAIEFLEQELSKGEQSSDDLIIKAKEYGISRNAIFEAKKELGVRAHKVGYQGKWSWALPEEPEEQQESKEYQ